MPNLSSFKYFSDIIQAMTMSLLKADKFRVEIHTPIIVANHLIGYEFLCESVGFPFHTFNSAEEFYALKHNKSAQSVDYDPITLTFVINTDVISANRAMNLFINWNKVIKPEHGLYGYLDDYAAIININILNDRLENFKTAKLHNAYPINIDNIEFARDSGEQLALLSVSFLYSKITYE